MEPKWRGKLNCSVLSRIFRCILILFGFFCLFIQIGLETMWLCVNRWWLNFQAIGRNVIGAMTFSTFEQSVQRMKESGYRMKCVNKWTVAEYKGMERIVYQWTLSISRWIVYARHKGRNALYLRHLCVLFFGFAFHSSLTIVSERVMERER